MIRTTSENKQLSQHTDDTMGRVAVPQHSCKTKIANFNLSKMPIDKDIITLKVSMDNRRVVLMEINKPFQDLPSPRLDCSDIYPQVLIFVSSQEQDKVIQSKNRVILSEEKVQVNYCRRVPEVNSSVMKLRVWD